VAMAGDAANEAPTFAAAAAMTLSSASVISNALRLYRVKL
jgi:cation transport ATPase